MDLFDKNMKRYLGFFMALSLLITLGHPLPVNAKSVPKFSKSKVIVYMDKPVTLSVKNTKKNISFSSSKKSVVSVRKVSKTKVKLVPKAPGKATVTAKVSGKKIQCKVTVRYKNYKNINANIDGKDFIIQLYDNKSARALYKKLPMALSMEELNGNEKYYEMSEELPSKDRAVKKIHAGDFMLYDSDYLVLFYKTFHTSYSYTPLGKIKDLSGFAKALSKNKVKVTFSKKGTSSSADDDSSNVKEEQDSTETPAATESQPVVENPATTETPTFAENPATTEMPIITENPVATEVPTATETSQSESRVIQVKVGEQVMEAVLEDNTSAAEFLKLLEAGAVTIDMHDYGSFEKVGSLGTNIVRNDVSITTTPGDIILYQGNQVTIYYDENTWSFTKLGHITGATKEQLLSVLGEGSVTVTFSKK